MTEETFEGWSYSRLVDYRRIMRDEMVEYYLMNDLDARVIAEYKLVCSLITKKAYEVQS